MLTWPNWPLKLRTSSSHEEGANRNWSVSTKLFNGQKNVESLTLKKVEWKKNEEGQMVIKDSQGKESEVELKADLVLLAMGFVHPKHDGLISQFKLKKDEKGNLLADTKNYLTSESSIYAAGDARRGQSLVVWAIREGREAASAIHGHLSS